MSPEARPVPFTQAGCAPRVSAHFRISAWSVVTFDFAVELLARVEAAAERDLVAVALVERFRAVEVDLAVLAEEVFDAPAGPARFTRISAGLMFLSHASKMAILYPKLSETRSRYQRSYRW